MVYISKKEKYEKERTGFTEKLLELLKDGGDEFSVNRIILTNKEKTQKLREMIEEFKIYFKTVDSLKPGYKGKLQNPILTMIKCVLKQQDINFEVSEKTIKMEKGKYKSMKFYKILRN
jgi:hypothetical protein